VGHADLPAPGTTGTYYLGAIADYPGTLRELIETNNVKAGAPISIRG